ncbi:PREDICTED: gametocyte-specific factor 1 [Dufourea novaeangliae]|uniref:Gametocyte-specific factor 1 n=1 Tax=Dufourea novaeangliae TaxID=178035 RepID=A0A154PUF1_DUFNO|nr:PREDICTED: gametocyte-specific factor 1 [Dufourea novaeangliae]KZC14830.1 Gametocyte-specific factor 1 [Dufourea novaeangliae]
MYTCLKLIDPVVICPYNKSHLIAKSRLQIHIVKCEKQYPENYKVMCPYNATHRMFKTELEEHIITCPTRSVSEAEMYSETRNHGSINFPVPSEISSTIDCTENWDLDVDNSYTTTDDRCSVNISFISEKRTDNSNVKVDTDDKEELRAPRGYSEAMLRESNEESCVEDVESVISSMGIGRGKITKGRELLKKVGLGRGRPVNTD